MIKSRTTHNANVILLPMPWRIYCFLSERGSNLIREWLDDEGITPAQRATFQSKIDLFERSGPDLSPGFITPTPIAADIYKIKVRGPVQLRPMACRGPFDLDREYTILLGWIERNNERVPNEVKVKAQQNRAIVVRDPSRRRRERIN
jgi:hypothetical protein